MRLTRTDVALGASVAGCFLFAYSQTLWDLLRCWNTDPNYSHGFLVPVVSLYLAHRRLVSPPVSRLATGGIVTGALIVVLGLAIRSITVFLPSLVIPATSMLVVLAGLILLLGGWGLWQRVWAPVAFLVFMIPLPVAIYKRLTFPLQLFVSEVSAELLSLAGLPVFVEGNLIHLPGNTMHVAEACSGLRQLTAFLALACGAAILLQRPAWCRATLVLSAVPIALVTNVLRVFATGVLMHVFGAGAIEGVLHSIEGLAMVAGGLLAFWAEVRLLDWLHERPADQSPATAAGGLHA